MEQETLAFTRGTCGTGDKAQIWQLLDQIANRDTKKKKKKKWNPKVDSWYHE